MRLGATIGSQDPVESLLDMGFSDVQVYLVPGTTSQELEAIARSGLRTVVHAAHEVHGFNFADGMTPKNASLVDEALVAASVLNAEAIIFHPGYVLTERLQITPVIERGCGTLQRMRWNRPTGELCSSRTCRAGPRLGLAAFTSPSS